MSEKTCPICREEHEPRGLSFDGKGVNSCGMYRNRLATFQTEHAAAQLGNLFAAAPDLLATCEKMVAEARDGDVSAGTCLKAARAIAKAKGGAS